MTAELVHGFRNGYLENIYRGDLVVVRLGRSGEEVVYELGNRFKRTFWRSSAKPFQAVPFVEAGGMEQYKITGEELALMCASHGGEAGHIEAVRGLLEKFGLSDAHLNCGAVIPMHQKTAQELLKQQKEWTQLHNCCSGKHAGMLAIAALKGYELDDYEKIKHPLQQEVLGLAAEVSGVAKEDIGIGLDGCGAPIFYFPIYNMARAYALLSQPGLINDQKRSEAVKLVAKAMTEHPWYVAGTDRLDTILMETTGGRVLAKLGADGVYCVSVMERGIGIAMKIECGLAAPIGPVIVELLRRLEYIDRDEEKSLKEKLDFKVYNRRSETVGEIKAVF